MAHDVMHSENEPVDEHMETLSSSTRWNNSSHVGLSSGFTFQQSVIIEQIASGQWCGASIL